MPPHTRALAHSPAPPRCRTGSGNEADGSTPGSRGLLGGPVVAWLPRRTSPGSLAVGSLALEPGGAAMARRQSMPGLSPGGSSKATQGEIEGIGEEGAECGPQGGAGGGIWWADGTERARRGGAQGGLWMRRVASHHGASDCTRLLDCVDTPLLAAEKEAPRVEEGEEGGGGGAATASPASAEEGGLEGRDSVATTAQQQRAVKPLFVPIILEVRGHAAAL